MLVIIIIYMGADIGIRHAPVESYFLHVFLKAFVSTFAHKFARFNFNYFFSV